jgi:NitT/TauT family transport system substrate-binding protein
MVRQAHTLPTAMSIAWLALLFAYPAAAETITIGIGTQDTTTNTVTTGVVIRELHLLEKYLPTGGKYANVKFEFEWQNFTSGPPRHQRHDGQQIAIRRHGGLSPHRQRLHLRKQS